MALIAPPDRGLLTQAFPDAIDVGRCGGITQRHRGAVFAGIENQRLAVAKGYLVDTADK